MIPSVWVQKVRRVTGGLGFRVHPQYPNWQPRAFLLVPHCAEKRERERERERKREEEGNVGTSMGDYMSNSQHFPKI